jgi:hypothetical protein
MALSTTFVVVCAGAALMAPLRPVHAQNHDPVVLTVTVPQGLTNVQYNGMIRATGGVAPYVFHLSGNLPGA